MLQGRFKAYNGPSRSSCSRGGDRDEVDDSPAESQVNYQDSVDLLDSPTGGGNQEAEAIPASFADQQDEGWYSTIFLQPWPMKAIVLRRARISGKAMWIQASITSSSTLDGTSPEEAVRGESHLGGGSTLPVSTTRTFPSGQVPSCFWLLCRHQYAILCHRQEAAESRINR